MAAGQETTIVIDHSEPLISPSPPPCDVQHWLSSILREPEQPPPNHKKLEVPPMLRQFKGERFANCYDPKVVSIGPLHHGKEELKEKEKSKERLTRDFVGSTNQREAATVLYNGVANVAREARQFYDDGSTQRFNDTAFTRLMFLDGCFLLQFIHCLVHGEEDKMKLKRHDIALVRRDLFLLENQLPFIVLKVLMNLRYGTGDEGKQERKQLLRCFLEISMPSPPDNSFLGMKEFFPRWKILFWEASAYQNDEADPVHLLEHMWRQLINPKAFAHPRQGGSKNQQRTSWYSYRSVRELKTAGIRLRPNKIAFFLSDVRYDSTKIAFFLSGQTSRIRIPPVTIDDSTKSLFLNLVAYEMCPDGPNDSGVTSYLWFMDSLIDHAEDVKELRQRGILLNCLGSDQDVADLFNEIARDLVPNPHAYADVKEKIEEHYKNKAGLLLLAWVMEWFNTYFSSPWTFIALLGAVLIVVLTFIQTYYAVPDGWIKKI